jgi:hypothetical protein
VESKLVNVTAYIGELISCRTMKLIRAR